MLWPWLLHLHCKLRQIRWGTAKAIQKYLSFKFTELWIIVLGWYLGMLGTTYTTNAHYIIKNKKNCFSVLGYFRRTPDNGDFGSTSAVFFIQKPKFTSRTQHTFISASVRLTFEWPACWLVPVNWYYDSALHINVDLILHCCLTQHIWMTLSSTTAGNHLISKVPISGINFWLKKAGTIPNAQSMFYSDGNVCVCTHSMCKINFN